MPYIHPSIRDAAKNSPESLGELAFYINRSVNDILLDTSEGNFAALVHAVAVFDVLESCVGIDTPIGGDGRIAPIVDTIRSFADRKMISSHTIRAVILCSKLEFFRRIVFPYEDKQLEKNGDVFDRVVKWLVL